MANLTVDELWAFAEEVEKDSRDYMEDLGFQEFVNRAMELKARRSRL